MSGKQYVHFWNTPLTAYLSFNVPMSWFSLCLLAREGGVQLKCQKARQYHKYSKQAVFESIGVGGAAMTLS